MRPTIAHIKRATAAAFSVPVSVMSPTDGVRTYYSSHPRQAAMYLSRKLTLHSLPMLGLHFRRDHTTVMFGRRACIKRMSTDLNYAVRVHIAEWNAQYLADCGRWAGIRPLAGEGAGNG